jgi:hypothetical protein
VASTTRSGQNRTFKERLFLGAERFSREHYGVVFALVAVLAGASIWLSAGLKLEFDVLSLLPRGNRQIDTFKTALRDFGSLDYLLVLVEAGEHDGPDDLEDFTDVFAEKLRALDGLVDSVEYRFRPDSAFLSMFSENALLFLPPEDLPRVAAKLTDEAILQQIHANRLALASPAASLTTGFLLRDPIGLMPFFVNRLLGHRGALKLDLADGYYLSQDGRSLLMLVKPHAPSQDVDAARRLIAAAREAEVASLAQVGSAAEDEGGPRPGVRVRYAGNYAIAVEETDLVRQDARFNVLFSLAAVTALYWLCYRRIAALAYSGLPLLVGQAITFAAAYLALGSLNSASSSSFALLMGLGTDFTIVMYARYVEERRRGASLAVATERMVGETGLGVFTGAITSAGTFYAMCVSRFRGLFDLGFLIGTGILVCAVIIVFLMPAMIAWHEGRLGRKRDSVRKLHLQSFGVEHLMRVAARHRAATVAAVAVLAAVGGFLASRLDFDDSIKSLRSNRAEATRVQDAVAEKFGASLSYMVAIAEGRDLEEAMRNAEKVEQRLRPFVARGVIGSYESLLNYLPPPGQQREVIEVLREGSRDAFSPQRIEATFVRGLEQNGFRTEAFAEYIGGLRQFLSPKEPLRLEDLEARGLGRIVERYLHRGPDGVRIVTYIYSSDPRWKREPPPGLVEAVSGDDPRIVVTGTNVMAVEMRKIFKRDAARALLLGLALVSGLLWIDFRSLRLTSIAIAQLLSGVAMMFGMMKLSGLEINYVNAFAATMILGVGIDYSIHLIHRLKLNRGRVDDSLLETGKAVVMAALTNVAGFGTLMLGNYPALRSLGTVALYGSLACLFTSLTLVPALMAVRDR